MNIFRLYAGGDYFPSLTISRVSCAKSSPGHYDLRACYRINLGDWELCPCCNFGGLNRDNHERKQTKDNLMLPLSLSRYYIRFIFPKYEVDIIMSCKITVINANTTFIRRSSTNFTFIIIQWCNKEFLIRMSPSNLISC